MTLTLSKLDDNVYRILTDQGLHVGNLKLISGLWKFKAIGYAPNGDVKPGWGPLTALHNTIITAPDEALINAKLLPA
jgi:hypothetical protein